MDIIAEYEKGLSTVVNVHKVSQGGQTSITAFVVVGANEPPRKKSKTDGCLNSAEWNDGMEWWNGMEWNSGITTPTECACTCVCVCACFVTTYTYYSVPNGGHAGLLFSIELVAVIKRRTSTN